MAINSSPYVQISVYTCRPILSYMQNLGKRNFPTESIITCAVMPKGSPLSQLTWIHAGKSHPLLRPAALMARTVAVIVIISPVVRGLSITPPLRIQIRSALYHDLPQPHFSGYPISHKHAHLLS